LTYCTKIKRGEEERRMLTYCTMEDKERRRLQYCAKIRKEE
jgi:hypothetical protein